MGETPESAGGTGSRCSCCLKECRYSRCHSAREPLVFSCERARYAFDGCSRLESSVVAPRCALSQLSGVLGSADWSGSGAAAGAVARDGEHHLAERPRLEDALRAEHAQVARLRVMSELHHARKLRGAVAQCERVEHGARVWLPRGVVPRRLRAGEALVCQDDTLGSQPPRCVLSILTPCGSFGGP